MCVREGGESKRGGRESAGGNCNVSKKTEGNGLSSPHIVILFGRAAILARDLVKDFQLLPSDSTTKILSPLSPPPFTLSLYPPPLHTHAHVEDPKYTIQVRKGFSTLRFFANLLNPVAALKNDPMRIRITSLLRFTF